MSSVMSMSQSNWSDWAILAGLVVAGYSAYTWVFTTNPEPQPRVVHHDQQLNNPNDGTCLRTVSDNYDPTILWSPPRVQTR